MGRIIKRQDIRRGDKIIIHRTVEVATDLDDDGDFKDASGNWVEVSEFDFVDCYEIELVNRPLPPLPTEKGTVIAVSREGTTETGIWMLTVTPLGTPRWVSASYVDKTPEGMLTFLQERARTFEVIA